MRLATAIGVKRIELPDLLPCFLQHPMPPILYVSSQRILAVLGLGDLDIRMISSLLESDALQLHVEEGCCSFRLSLGPPCEH